MAAAYSSLNPVDILTDLVTALTAKSLITTNYYQTATYLIILTPITAKVIKIVVGTGGLDMYYGDAYVSGSTITNAVQFLGKRTSGTLNAVHAICDTTYFAVIVQTGAAEGQQLGYVGITDNAKVVVFGIIAITSFTYYTSGSCIGKNITDATNFYPISLGCEFNNAGNIFSMNLMMRDASSGQVLMNGANPAYITGLKNCSVINSVTGFTKGATYVITASTGGMGTGITVLFTSLLLEFA